VVVTPSQVTCPGSPTEQLRSTAEQLLELTLLEQDTLMPPPQLAVALQRAFSPIRWRCTVAARRTAFCCCAAQPPVVGAGSPRIAARA
jgi:hypothetical protein